MNCPYCGSEMRSGTVRFDGRRRLEWTPEGEQRSFWDSIGGIGTLTAAEYTWAGIGSIKGAYCSSCKKLIIETDIQN